MLHLVIPKQELWDPIREKFVSIEGAEFDLEHSLFSVSKWESKWHTPFHDDRKKKTAEQNIDYVRCMCVTEGIEPKVFNYLSEKNVKDIIDYIGDSNTATWFNEGQNKKTGRKEIITAEIIYYWMTVYNVPESYQMWHLNKLMTLLRVCAEKNNPDKKKTNSGQLAAQRRALVAARRKKYNTRG